MGRAKALLPWGGRTMLESVVETLLAQCETVVVVAHPGQRLPELPDRVRRVEDPAELDDQGPLVGVQAGLAALEETDLVYLAATDKPNVSAEHVTWMFEHVGDADGLVPVDAHAPSGRRRVHPLSGVLRVGPARPVVADLIASGERALRLAFERLGCEEVPVDALPDPLVLRDYNTPEAYQAALRELEA